MTTIDLVYFNAGGGHRAAAQALEAVIREQRRPWQVRCVDLVTMVDPAARFRRFTGLAPEDLYNKPLARGWTLGMGPQLRALQGLVRLGHAPLVQRLQRHWQRAPADMVVSLLPNFNRAIAGALARALPGAPFVTVLTDLADHPPHFWIEPEVAQHVVCGTERAVEQALALGCERQRIHRVSGMVIRPDFYPPLAADREVERARLGLRPDRRTAVVMFGGQGSAEMLEIDAALDDVQLVLMCGHNRALAAELAQRAHARDGRAPRAVVGFTAEVRRHLQLGDLFIGKPGPGCLSEAVQQGLPIVTVRNARTMPQERYNTDWVREHGLGVVVRRWAEVKPAVHEVLGRLDHYRAAVARVDNRAVFEVPAVLEQVLRRR
ncbi:MAG: galactosyldiacylglycerol synthase, partial [Burkholderiales bacterium]|nr:galactosyldiacylglycerol synthase [Burkholderiales bacterium]